MKILSIRWTEDSVDHIARHGVEPKEVEEICFRRPLVQRAGRKRDMVYYARGQTEAGRYLTVVFRYLGSWEGFVITARDMDEAERRRFRQRRQGR